MKKKLLILGAGPLQVPLIEAAQSMNIYTIAVDWDKEAAGQHIADEFYPISTNDIPALVELARRLNIDGVVTNSDYPVRAVSKVAEVCGLPALSCVSAVIATNKLLLREVLREAGITAPAFAKVERLEDVAHQAASIGYPFILKPVDSSASRGVSLVASEDQIAAAYHRAAAFSRNGILIMEQFIQGLEFSVEAFSTQEKIEIIAITQKLTSGPPFFVETGHMIPAELRPELVEQIHQFVRNALDGIGLHFGPSHSEIKVNETGVYLIEIGPRLGGDFITTDLVPLATGYSMVNNTIRQAISEPLLEEVTKQAAAGVTFFQAVSGTITSITGLEAIQQLHPVRLELFKRVGDLAGELKSSLDRVGYAIVEGGTRIEVAQQMEEIAKRLVISTR